LPNLLLKLYVSGGNVEETLNTSNGANLRRSETSSYLPFASASSAVRAVYAVRAVRCFVTPTLQDRRGQCFMWPHRDGCIIMQTLSIK